MSTISPQPGRIDPAPSSLSAPKPPAPGASTPLAVALLALLAVFWGFNWPIMKVGLAEIPPWVFRGSASVVSGIGLFAVAKIGGHSLRIPREKWRPLILSAMLNMALWNILVLYGIDLMDAGRAGILAYTMPLWATLVGAFVLKDRLGIRAIAGLALGLAGMALLFSVDAQSLAGPPLGPLLVVVAAFCWGAGTVVVKHAGFTQPVTVVCGWQHLIGVIPVLVIMFVWDIQNVGDVTFWPAMAVVYNMTVTGILCYWAYFKVVSMLPVVASTVGTLMVPVVGVFANALIFSVEPQWVDYAALLCVGGAVFLVMTRRR
ncbi:MAG: DMT family transporter [Thalassobaculaceae bacterium]|nr:DMT family transporter [Thalassobaculaceae bacterium]